MDGQRLPPPTARDEKHAISLIAEAIQALAKEMAGIKTELSKANEELHRFLDTR
jgi:hypothetical protein